MSPRDPAHLDNLPPTGNSPDNPFREGDCEHCDGTGDDLDLLEARGYRMDCEHCGGTGAAQEPTESDPEFYMEGGE